MSATASTSTSTYPAPLNLVNPNYLVQITGTDELGNPIGTFQGNQYAGNHYGIIAALPEEFVLSTESSWEPLLNAMAEDTIGKLFSGLGKEISDVTQAISGFSAIGTAFTQQVWRSTTPVTFRLPLLFNAVYDAASEVMLPIMQLLSLTLPSTVNNLFGLDLTNSKYAPLKAPGPTLGGNSAYKIAIHIGQAFTFANVIIESVSATFKTLPIANGDWVSADVELAVKTTRILTKGDLASYFRRGGTIGESS